MDVKDAVATAKAYLRELFAEDGIADIRLEEVEHDERDPAWNITLGFLRHREAPASMSALVASLDALASRRRVYRVVRVREIDGVVVSVKHRDLTADAA